MCYCEAGHGLNGKVAINVLLVLSFFLFLSILQPDMGKKSKNKTSVKKKTLNPEFNEVQLVSYFTTGNVFDFFTELKMTFCSESDVRMSMAIKHTFFLLFDLLQI